MANSNIIKLALILIILAILPSRSTVIASAKAASAATEYENKVVRVGWFASPYNQIDSLGNRSGYGYEYQRRVAANANWTYEYVEGTWIQLLNMLQKGEIDLLSDVTRIPEREQHMFFSDYPMGREDYYIVCLKDNKTVKRGHPETLNGKRIGVNSGNYHAPLLHKWLKEQGVDAVVQSCDLSPAEWFDALNSGKFDAIATADIYVNFAKDKCVTVAHLGSSSVYFAVSKQRPDIRRDLDFAMEKIAVNNSAYVHDLYTAYFSHNNIYQLSPDEEDWVRKHGTIRIGYQQNYMPFCGQDPETGKLTGALGDLFDTVNEKMAPYGMHIEAIAYPSFSVAMQDMLEGKIDAAYPNGMSPSAAEQAGLIITDPVTRSTEVAVVRSDYDFDMDKHLRIAFLSTNKKVLPTVQEQFPGWDVVLFPDIDACFKGIANDEADVVIANNYRIYKYYDEMDRMGLKPVPTGYMIDHSFAVTEGECELYAIMNRIIQSMPDDETCMSLVKYAITQREPTFEDFVRSHVVFVVVFLMIINGVFAFLLIVSIRARRKAKRANLAKTRFLFNMSHDIRTPMNAIIGYSNLMKAGLADHVKAAEYLDKICTSSQFLLDLINNILEMSRIESGKIEVVEQPHIGKDILSDLESVYRDIMEQKNITFICTTTVKTEAIYCDRMKINQLFLNLLSNAHKYTPRGGTVKFCVEECINPDPDYTTIVARVSDTGIGMSEEYLPHLFEDFTRERTFTDNHIIGTGLGMSIVKRLVDLMHGTISVESELGKGTTFTVRIPFRIADSNLVESHHNATAESNVASDNGEASRHSLEGLNVLLAEDNELNAEIAIAILSDKGISVTWAKDGQECVDMLTSAEANTYDLILMDVQMPVMNGYEATKSIRKMADSRKASIPIIAMTANAFAEDKENALRAGMNAHLAKPIDVPALIQCIGKLML